MAREERQRERKRRRRRDENAAVSDAGADPNAASDTELEWNPDDAPPESVQPPEISPPAAVAPAAVEQILAAPSRERMDSQSASPRPLDPFFAHPAAHADDED